MQADDRQSATDAQDRHRLDRFIDAPTGGVERVLAELRAARKRSHRLWYMFPQIAGLGHSASAAKALTHFCTGHPERKTLELLDTEWPCNTQPCSSQR